MEVRIKDPDERIAYDIDFGRNYFRDYPGDTIESIAVAVDEESGVTEDGTDFTDDTVKVWLTGGTDGKTAHVTVTITTVQGRVKEYCFRVRIKDC